MVYLRVKDGTIGRYFLIIFQYITERINEQGSKIEIAENHFDLKL